MTNLDDRLDDRLHALLDGADLPTSPLADDLTRGRARVRRQRFAGGAAGLAAAAVLAGGWAVLPGAGPGDDVTATQGTVASGTSTEPPLEPGATPDWMQTPNLPEMAEQQARLDLWQGILQEHLTPGGERVGLWDEQAGWDPTLGWIDKDGTVIEIEPVGDPRAPGFHWEEAPFSDTTIHGGEFLLEHPDGGFYGSLTVAIIQGRMTEGTKTMGGHWGLKCRTVHDVTCEEAPAPAGADRVQVSRQRDTANFGVYVDRPDGVGVRVHYSSPEWDTEGVATGTVPTVDELVAAALDPHFVAP
jgi:hypothetical protein